MKLYAAANKLIDWKSPNRQLKRLIETGFEGVWIDYTGTEDSERFDRQQAICNIRNACMDLGIDCIERESCDYAFTQYKEVNGHFMRGLNCSAEEVVNTVADGKLCYDVGVANICGLRQDEFLSAARQQLGMVVLRDTNGIDDDHLMPYTCASRGGSKTDWQSVIKALREIEFDGIMVVDFGDTASAMPVFLRESIIEQAAAIGRFIVWQVQMKSMLRRYSRLVLFGAGNMCRNYMKCYGQQFMPLFTCDNNSARWGQTFEGLEIKNPEALKELDEDVAIILCNVYYDEIEAQIRAMGLPNPIERFSDEVMPSFYTDRLEYWEG